MTRSRGESTFAACVAAALLVCETSATFAGPIDKDLHFNESYVTSIARTANNAAVSGAIQVRDALKGQVIGIPATWRLVSVIPKAGGYVMFFQDSDATVRSLGIDSSGALTGDDTLVLRSYSRESGRDAQPR
jgi:hypothetical protein